MRAKLKSKNEIISIHKSRPNCDINISILGIIRAWGPAGYIILRDKIPFGKIVNVSPTRFHSDLLVDHSKGFNIYYYKWWLEWIGHPPVKKYADSFKNVKKGNRVFSIIYGWGTVLYDATAHSDKTIRVIFDNFLNKNISFKTCGREFVYGWEYITPTLFFKEMAIKEK